MTCQPSLLLCGQETPVGLPLQEPCTSHHLHMIFSTGVTGSQGMGGRANLPEHPKQQKERGHKRKDSVSVSLSSLTHTCTHTHARMHAAHTHQFGARCSQLSLWTPGILLLGLQEAH